MSTFLLLILQLLADMGVPMMEELGERMDPGHAVVGAPHRRAESADRGAGSRARGVPETDGPEKRPTGFSDDTEISNGF